MIEYWGNVIEAGFWMAIAAIVYWRSDRRSGPRLGTGEWTAVILFWFGISDLVETTTGAWYRPLALLVMKGACIAGLLLCYIRYRQSLGKRDSDTKPEP